MKLKVAMVLLLAFAPPAFAKGKKTKKPVATAEPLPARVVLYDPAQPGGPATVSLNGAPEAKVPDAPLMLVTVDKAAGKGEAEEKKVIMDKGKTAK